MRFVFYTHSLVSDWNHGNAHFLRGIMRELNARGHATVAREPANGWSRENLVAEQGQHAIARFARDFPELRSESHGEDFDHEAALADADVVIVHEWTAPELVERLGAERRRGARFSLLFHDTHHRAVSAENEIAGLALDDYDGVLAFGETLSERYRAAGWGRRVFTWHEAADVRLFRPRVETAKTGDIIWIGNWGDDERTAEIGTFLVEPARSLGLSGSVRGVRYPEPALASLRDAGLSYGGWIANADVPDAFARHRVTVHVPRRPYVRSLPGIPTIRMFEALACGIPLVSAPWEDSEAMFRPGMDFLFARTGAEMELLLCRVLRDRDLAASLGAHGLETIRARHTCRHRVDQLLDILTEIGAAGACEALAPLEAAQ